ncbi:MAG: hypothetical protein IJ723_07205, partial [Ruminococcus sp.]|nr:hypothetical protein [Ruminococcus sp.]
MTVEELCVLLLNAGATIRDMHDITYGMAINILAEKNRLMAAISGKETSDPEKQYSIMKANLPALEAMYKSGRI